MSAPVPTLRMATTKRMATTRRQSQANITIANVNINNTFINTSGDSSLADDNALNVPSASKQALKKQLAPADLVIVKGEDASNPKLVGTGTTNKIEGGNDEDDSEEGSDVEWYMPHASSSITDIDGDDADEGPASPQAKRFKEHRKVIDVVNNPFVIKNTASNLTGYHIRTSREELMEGIEINLEIVRHSLSPFKMIFFCGIFLTNLTTIFSNWWSRPAKTDGGEFTRIVIVATTIEMGMIGFLLLRLLSVWVSLKYRDYAAQNDVKSDENFTRACQDVSLMRMLFKRISSNSLLSFLPELKVFFPEVLKLVWGHLVPMLFTYWRDFIIGDIPHAFGWNPFLAIFVIAYKLVLRVLMFWFTLMLIFFGLTLPIYGIGALWVKCGQLYFVATKDINQWSMDQNITFFGFINQIVSIVDIVEHRQSGFLNSFFAGADGSLDPDERDNLLQYEGIFGLKLMDEMGFWLGQLNFYTVPSSIWPRLLFKNDEPDEEEIAMTKGILKSRAKRFRREDLEAKGVDVEAIERSKAEKKAAEKKAKADAKETLRGKTKRKSITGAKQVGTAANKAKVAPITIVVDDDQIETIKLEDAVDLEMRKDEGVDQKEEKNEEDNDQDEAEERFFVPLKDPNTDGAVAYAISRNIKSAVLLSICILLLFFGFIFYFS